MSSVHRLPGKPNWYCFYSDHTGKRRCKTTRTTNKKEAERICGKLQEIEDLARTGRLTEDRARRVIEGAVSEIMESFGAPIERKTIRQHFDAWAKNSEVETAPATAARYQTTVKRFLEFLGSRSDRPLAGLRSADIQAYRDSLAGKVANVTVNLHLRIIRMALKHAVMQRVFDVNPGKFVENLAATGKSERRAFTLDELRKLLAVAGQDWKTAILVSLYTGLRLSDVVSLTWANLDLQQGELTIRTQKTGRMQIVPVAKPLRRHLDTLPAGDDPKAPLCPGFQIPGKALSNQFYDLMASAGLVQPRTHTKKKAGRAARRTMSEISFHALRHTATSLLKNAGVSDVIARDIIGHESEAVSRTYTHIESETKRAALDKLPDVTS